MLTDPVFRPSEVVLAGVLPLVGTMGRVEREVAAAIFVRACHVNGDRWQALTPVQIGEAIRADLDAGVEPWVTLNRNPFVNADFRDLVAAGYAASTLERGAPLELTSKAFTALERWVRRAG